MSIHVVLVGLMASGKTTVGRALARRLGRPFVDNDEQLFALTGRTARAIHEESGPSELHRLEAQALHAALDHPDDAVVAAAAATVLDPSVRDALDPHWVAWLDASPEVLAARGADDAHRPLGPDPVAALRRMHEERRAHYAAVADVVVATDDLGRAEEVAADLAGLVRSGRSPSARAR